VAHPISVSALPTVSEAFEHEYRLRKAFNLLGVHSLIPIMLMPREALMELPFIGASSAHRITKILHGLNLSHRTIYEKLTRFIDDQFGCIEDAPIGVLQVATVRTSAATRPHLAPLDTINALEVYDREMTVLALTSQTRQEVRKMAQMALNATGRQVHDLDEDLKHLSSRLSYFGADFSGSALPMTAPLYAVR